LLTWLRELAATVGTFDRTALEPGYALRCTIGVAIPLVIAALAGNPAAGVPAAIGAFITGFTSLQGIYRTRLAAVLAAAIGMSVTTFVGALAAHSTPALVAATAIAAYAFGTIGQLGPAASTVALNSFVAFVLFSSQPLAPATAALDSALVLAGGLIQALLLLVAWPTARGVVERAALAAVYRRLAEYATAIAKGTPSLPPITPFATARQVLADPQPFASAAELARFNRLLEDSEAIRKRLGALASTIASDPKDEAARADAASVAKGLDVVAKVLDGTERIEIDSAQVDAPHLRDALEAAAMLATGRLPKLGLLSRPLPGPYVQNHIDFFARDSLRFALVLSVAMVLGRHFAADRGYWIPLTAALVLKPDFQTTFFRGAARIAGTIVGAVVASAVIVVTGHQPLLQVSGILLATAAAYLTFNPNYALFTVAITSFVVLVLGMRGLPGTTTIDARLLDTLAGGALAMIGYVILPSWERKRTPVLLAELLDAQRRLAVAILRAYAMPSIYARSAIEAARTQVWKVRTTVEASIDRARSEPRGRHTTGAGRVLRILAASQRFALASLALEGALAAQPGNGYAWLLPLAEAVDADMAELVAALRESRRAACPGRLATAIGQVQTNLGGTLDARQQFILDRVRAYAEAIARITRLISGRHYSSLGVDSP
jgi:uncharacterized membrane protein YccC